MGAGGRGEERSWPDNTPESHLWWTELIVIRSTFHQAYITFPKLVRSAFASSGQTIARLGSRVGAVVRALASHQCVPGSIPGPGVICGLSLLVLYSAPRGFSPGSPVFPSPQKPTFLNSNAIWTSGTLVMSLWLG